MSEEKLAATNETTIATALKDAHIDDEKKLAATNETTIATALKDAHIDDEKVVDQQDQTDATSFGHFGSSKKTPLRPTAVTKTLRNDDRYSMEHGRRGDCIIFVHERYDPAIRLSSRPSANHDAMLCKTAFQSIGFEVQVFKDLTVKKFKERLQEASERDHEDCDALAVVFMSHGDLKMGEEVIFAKDGSIKTCELWEPFVGNKCTTLAGKPKMFFIQACRGEKLDNGVGLRASTDSVNLKKKDQLSYAIPAHADLLVMWASYPGMFAFKSSRNGMQGSVFIHFLAEELLREGSKTELLNVNEILLKVTREVALEYESYCPDQALHQNKQVPHSSSTLMRNIIFPARLR